MIKMVCVLITLLFIPGFILVARAQGIEYEIAIGPQFTKAVVSDYSVGIISDNKPLTNRFPVGYTIGLTVRNHSEHLQLGLNLIQDYTTFNVYLPVQWPADFDSKKSSRWNNYYQAFRFGLGGQIRYSFGKEFVQTGLSYLSTVSAKSRSTQYHASDNSVEDTEGEDYSKEGGLLAGITFGTQINKSDLHPIDVSIGLQYSFYEQRYVYETFLHDWTVRPINCSLMIGYQFAKAGRH